MDLFVIVIQKPVRCVGGFLVLKEQKQKDRLYSAKITTYLLAVSRSCVSKREKLPEFQPADTFVDTHYYYYKFTDD